MSFDECYGYTGKLLRIDLSQEKVNVEEIKPEILRKFIGGVGYGVKLLYDELSPGIDALGPENKIAFVTGPLTGTGAPGRGKKDSGQVCNRRLCSERNREGQSFLSKLGGWCNFWWWGADIIC